MKVRSVDGTTNRATDRVEATRQRILAAALKVFAQRGYDGTAVPLIATEAGVGTGTIYRHFQNKEHLVNVLFRETKRRLWAGVLGGLDPSGDPEDLFASVWAGLGQFAHEEPLAFQFVEMQHHAPYLDNESRELERKVMLPLAEWIGGQGKGAVAVDPEHLIAMFWGAFVGLVKAERLGQLALDENSIRHAGKRLWRGMRMVPKHD
ncbi:MAG: TetR/AcrR family transcriptional regulator [Polyangiales bacterium]